MMTSALRFGGKGRRFGVMTSALRFLGAEKKVGSFEGKTPRAVLRGVAAVVGGSGWILEGYLQFHKEMRIALIFFFELAKSTDTDFVVGTFE